MKRTYTAQKFLIVGLVLVAFLLRLFRLQAQSFWIDEGWTIYYANLSPAELWHVLQTTKIVPPLYHFLTLFWSRLMGDGEFSLRFCSVVFGTLAIPLAYRLGKSLGDRRAGVLLALLLAVSPYQIWHSQDARNYTMLTAASLLSMWAFVNLWQTPAKDEGKRLWFGTRFPLKWSLLYFLGTEWALLTHYHGFIIVGVQGLFLLLTWRRHWRDYLAWGSLLFVILAVFGTWLIFGLSLLKSYLNWIPQPGLLESYLRGITAYSVGELVPPAQAVPLVLVFAGLFVLGLIYAGLRSWRRWQGRQMLAFLLAYTLAPNLAAWVYGELRTPVYLERYLITVQVGFLLAVCLGVLAIFDGLRRGSRGRAGFVRLAAQAVAAIPLAALLVISGWVLQHHYFDPAYAKPDWRGVAQTIQDYEMPGDAIVLTGDGGERVFEYYYRGEAPVYTDFNTPVPPPEEAIEIIKDITGSHRRIWYSPYGVDIDATLERWLGRHAYPAWQKWIGRKRLALYAGTGNYPAHDLSLPAGDLTLSQLSLPADPVAAGDVLPLGFIWQADEPVDVDYGLSLRLTNKRGDIFAQSDWPPLTASGGTSTWPEHQPVTDHRGFWLPVETPPTEYKLQFVVYDAVTGQPFGAPTTISEVEVTPAQITVPVTALSIPNPTSQAVGPLTLVGFILPASVWPGQDMWLWLYWQAPLTGGFSLDPTTRVHLTLESGGQTISRDYDLEDTIGPLADWSAGQVRRAVYYLPTHPSLTGTRANITVNLLLPEGKTGEFHMSPPAKLKPVTLQQRPREFEAPAIPLPTDLSFGDPPVAKLIGYARPAGHGTPGSPLPITLFWQSVAETSVNYTVFVQLLDSDWKVVAQQDQQPLAGDAPTGTWIPGEILTDPYNLIVPADLPDGDYRLITGLYQVETGERLPVSNGSDFVELGVITVP